MKVPFQSPLRLLDRQKTEIDAAVRGVVNSGSYVHGPNVRAFEAALAATVGAPFALGCNSGTDALILSLRALCLQPGDEVIIPAFTAPPTVAAVVAAGGVPRFADVHPETWTIDPRAIVGLRGPRTRAVVPVHLFGNMAEMTSLLAFGFPLVEDVAQAQGARQIGKPAGSWGALGAFSFYPTKNLGALGDGGAVVTSDPTLAAKVERLRFYGQKDRYQVDELGGINSRLDEIQAAVLQVRLHAFTDWLGEKAELMRVYRDELRDLPLRFQRLTDGTEPAWHLAVVALDDSARRDELRAYLAEKEVETLEHYPVAGHLHPAFRAFAAGPLLVSERLAASVLSLPFFPGLRADEQSWVIECVKNFFRRH